MSLDHPDRFVDAQSERVGNRQLIHPNCNGGRPSGKHVGRIAQADRHIHLPQVLQEGVEVPPAHYAHRHFGLGKLHTAVKVHILPVNRVASDHHPRADVIAAIALAVEGNGQRVQIRLKLHHLLARRVRHDWAG